MVIIILKKGTVFLHGFYIKEKKCTHRISVFLGFDLNAWMNKYIKCERFFEDLERRIKKEKNVCNSFCCMFFVLRGFAICFVFGRERVFKVITYLLNNYYYCEN